MTLHQWYQLRYSGTWRTARTPHRCDRRPNGGMRCLTWVQTGERYYEPDLINPHGRYRLRICADCANSEVTI